MKNIFWQNKDYLMADGTLYLFLLRVDAVKNLEKSFNRGGNVKSDCLS